FLIAGERLVRGLAEDLAVRADESPREGGGRKPGEIVRLEQFQILVQDPSGAGDLVEGEASPLAELAEIRADRRHTCVGEFSLFRQPLHRLTELSPWALSVTETSCKSSGSSMG